MVRLRALGEDPGQKVQGFTLAELHAAFEMVRNPDGWKRGIDTRVRLTAREHDAVIEAAFFAGSPCRLVSVGEARSQTDVLYHVTAPGYYACIGA